MAYKRRNQVFVSLKNYPFLCTVIVKKGIPIFVHSVLIRDIKKKIHHAYEYIPEPKNHVPSTSTT